MMGPEANMSDKQNASVFHYVAGAHLFHVYNQVRQLNAHAGTDMQLCRNEKGLQPSGAHMSISLG